MKLALIRQKYNPYGGAEQFVTRAIQALTAQGTAVSLITRSWSGDHGLFDTLIVNPPYVGSLWRDWGFARAACQASTPFDLVQSHERLACCDIYRAGDGVHRQWLEHRARIDHPVRVQLTRLNPYHCYVLAAERRMFASPRLRAVICNSHMVRSEIERWFGLPWQKLPVIYSGVDTAAYHPDSRQSRRSLRQQLGLATEQPVFLHVGSGFQRKGVGTLLRTLALSPVAQAVIVGHDKHAKQFVTLAQQLGISSRVRFVGPQKEVKPYYGMADALFLPTLYDPFPNVALEAMASGLPLITSTQCGAAELIRQGENGYIFDALDIYGFSQAIAAFSNPDTASRAGTLARLTVEPYTLERMAALMQQLYLRLMRGDDAAISPL